MNVEIHEYADREESVRYRVQEVVPSIERGETAMAFCASAGWQNGVSGYMYHTLPVVLHIVMRHPNNFESAISEAIACGGDTDTIGAIVGGIVGAGVGKAGIPETWLTQLRDWPRTHEFIDRLGEELAVELCGGDRRPVPSIGLLSVWLRNAFFMVWVLLHGFRRLLPPY